MATTRSGGADAPSAAIRRSPTRERRAEQITDEQLHAAQRVLEAQRRRTPPPDDAPSDEASRPSE